MHEVKVKHALSTKNGMNIYRGCLHGCIYCDSRSTCYQMNHDFEDIEVKINIVELLEKELRSKRKKCMIGTGAMCDPYMPIEKHYLLTRQCLEVIDRLGFGATLITKSNLVLRDLDLLKSINTHSKCVVQMTLTTYNEDLCKIIEPNVCTTKERVKVLYRLRDEGIPTVVWLTPILPYLNDDLENLKGILRYCIQAKVKGIILWDFGVTLREGDREYFYQKLDEYFPGMKERYIKEYENSYFVGSKQNNALKKYFIGACKQYGIMYEPDMIFAYLNEYPQKYEQISLF